MSDFPGSEHRLEMIARLKAVRDMSPGSLGELLKSMRADYERDQATWNSANRKRPPDPVYDRLVTTIYGVLYPDTPWFPSTDTMELASMKAKTYALADAVYALLEPCEGGMGCQSPHEHFGVPYG
jgi:hypothetical protein